MKLARRMERTIHVTFGAFATLWLYAGLSAWLWLTLGDCR